MLKPKRTFTPHVSNHQSGTDGWDAEIIVHGPQSTRYGWEWYEMGFIACWNPSGLTTLVCFDVPERMRSYIQSLFNVNTVDSSSPYAIFSHVSEALLRLYDDSVWSIRNHISQWEAVGRSFYAYCSKQRLIYDREGPKRPTTFFCTRLQDTGCTSAKRYESLHGPSTLYSNTTRDFASA